MKPLPIFGPMLIVLAAFAGFVWGQEQNRRDAELRTAAESRRHELWMVSKDLKTAEDSLLDCANVALPTRKEADEYHQQKPGTHVFKVILEEEETRDVGNKRR